MNQNKGLLPFFISTTVIFFVISAFLFFQVKNLNDGLVKLSNDVKIQKLDYEKRISILTVENEKFDTKFNSLKNDYDLKLKNLSTELEKRLKEPEELRKKLDIKDQQLIQEKMRAGTLSKKFKEIEGGAGSYVPVKDEVKGEFLSLEEKIVGLTKEIERLKTENALLEKERDKAERIIVHLKTQSL